MTERLFRLARPFLMALDPEAAHGLTLRALRLGLAGSMAEADDPRLGTRVFGMDFPNPIGLAAGFDKNAEAPHRLLRLGFGFVEVGTITPRAQEGNPRPRIFRLSADRGVINRLGFNNEGLRKATRRLRRQARRKPGRGGGIVGANLGANKDSDDRPADYETGLRALYPYASYFTVNVSSPNTPGLRDLQGRAELDALLARLIEARTEMMATARAPMKPILLKIAPDMSDEQLADIASVAMSRGIDGMIVSNTTIGERSHLRSRHAQQPGGLSGAPLYELSTVVLAKMYRLTGGRLPLIGVGGVSSGREAYGKIAAGASLVQLYTALIYQGPGLVARIKRELLECLDRYGHATLTDAVGSMHKDSLRKEGGDGRHHLS
jgi:dihydroorotate dehydrogenase